MGHTDNHHRGQHRRLHHRGMTSLCFTCRTPTPRSPWHLASNRQDQTAKTRYAGERIGAAAATIPHASCMTSLSATHQITSLRWSYRHTKRTPQQTCVLRGHDHDGAYRQLPLDNPENAYVLLHTPQGPTLWSHNVLLFGSLASVWGYKRFGDAMVSVSRILLLCPAMHYVDDYGSTEITKHSSSGFQAFEDFNGALGYRMKPSKRQPPAQTHKIQGVNITIEQQHVVLTPCPQRVERMCQDILTCLNNNHLDPDMARRMAGKCNFLTGKLFGKVGRAPLMRGPIATRPRLTSRPKQPSTL